MWHLLYDPADPDAPFEMFLEDPPNSTTHHWSNLTDFYPYESPDSSDDVKLLTVAQWCAEIAGNAVYVLHSFPDQPTSAEILAAIHLHPELLI